MPCTRQRYAPVMVQIALAPASDADALIRFRVPDGWSQERESDGTIAFYDPSLQAGTLRVKVMTFTSEDPLDPQVATDELRAMEAREGQTVLTLPSGNAVRRHREEALVGEEPTVIWVWLLAGVDPPAKAMRMAAFSFSVLAADARSEATRRLVAVLDREIRAARFVHQTA